MKKIYSLALATFVCLSGFVSAQNLKQAGPKKLHVPVGNIQKQHADKKASRTTTAATWYIDYDESEYQLVGGTPETPAPSASYRRFIWDVNYNYVPTDSSTKYFTVAFDSLYDYATTSTYSLSPGEVITIDSIFVAAGHEKNTASSVNDTVLFRFHNLPGANNHPTSTPTTYTTVSVITNTNLSTTNNWLSSTVIAQKVNYTLPIGSYKFGCRLEYRGDKMDTLGVLAGFYDAGGPCTAGNPYRPQRSFYYPNSYRLINQYTSYGALPQAAGGDIYYDCDGSGTLDPNVDGRNFTQNVSMWVKVHISLATGVKELEESGVALSQNMPNPFTGSSVVKFQLAKDANSALFTVTDVTGRIVTSEKVATTTGIHTVNLGSYAPGIYYYSLNVDGHVSTKKMIVE